MNILLPSFIKKSNALFIVFFILHYLRLYNCVIYKIQALKHLALIIDMLFSFYFLFCYIRYKKKHHVSLLEKSVSLLFLIFWGSLIVGSYQGQNFLYALKQLSMLYLIWGFYYYLRLYNIKVEFLFALFRYMFIGYLLITVICYILFPHFLFGMPSYDNAIKHMLSEADNRGVMRFNLPCKMLIPFFIFFQISKLQMSIKDISNLLFLFVCLFLIGNRFPLAVTVLCSFLLCMTSKSLNLSQKVKLVVIFFVLGVLIYNIPFTRNIVNNMLEITSTQAEYGENDIRVISATYFFTELNEGDIFKNIFGNGIYTHDLSPYGKLMDYAHEIGYWESDVGYAEIFVYFGLIGLIALLIWFIGVLTVRIPSEYFFLKIYLIFIIISMICGGYWFENIVEMAIITYILVKLNSGYKADLIVLEIFRCKSRNIT